MTGPTLRGPIEIEEETEMHRGEGRTARICATGDATLLAKRFHSIALGAERRAKLEAMLANPPHAGVSIHDEIQFAWPQALLLTPVHGDCVGFVMHNARNAVRLDEMLYDEGKDYDQFHGDRSIRARLKVARYIAMGVGQLHAYGHLLIDAKPQNILVYPENHHVCFVDCDGYGFTSLGDQFFPASEMTDSYAAPELLAPSRRLPRTRYEDYPDRFSLGVLMFELLTGVHPYDGKNTCEDSPLYMREEWIAERHYPYAGRDEIPLRPPLDPDYDCLPPEVRATLDRAVGLGAPELRPTPREWLEVLDAAILQVGECANLARLAPHPWFEGETCPRCRRQGRATPPEEIFGDDVFEPDSAPTKSSDNLLLFALLCIFILILIAFGVGIYLLR